MLMALLQGIIDGLVGVLGIILGLLPKSPFVGIYNLSLNSDLLSSLAWLVPIPQMMAVLEAWGIAVGLFYLYMIVLRWVKAIE